MNNSVIDSQKTTVGYTPDGKQNVLLENTLYFRCGGRRVEYDRRQNMKFSKKRFLEMAKLYLYPGQTIRITFIGRHANDELDGKNVTYIYMENVPFTFDITTFALRHIPAYIKCIMNPFSIPEENTNVKEIINVTGDQW